MQHAPILVKVGVIRPRDAHKHAFSLRFIQCNRGEVRGLARPIDPVSQIGGAAFLTDEPSETRIIALAYIKHPDMAAMMRCILILATVALAVNAELIEHFIAAEYVDWDFAPSGMDLCRGMPLDDDASKTWTTVGIGTRYRKARFLAYPDDDWDAPLPRLAEEEHLGILGPLIRVAVGDTLRVHFINRLNHPANMAIPGLTIDRPDSTDFTVQPNKTAVWTWKVILMFVSTWAHIALFLYQRCRKLPGLSQRTPAPSYGSTRAPSSQRIRGWGWWGRCWSLARAVRPTPSTRNLSPCFRRVSCVHAHTNACTTRSW